MVSGRPAQRWSDPLGRRLRSGHDRIGISGSDAFAAGADCSPNPQAAPPRPPGGGVRLAPPGGFSQFGSGLRCRRFFCPAHALRTLTITRAMAPTISHVPPGAKNEMSRVTNVSMQRHRSRLEAASCFGERSASASPSGKRFVATRIDRKPYCCSSQNRNGRYIQRRYPAESLR